MLPQHGASGASTAPRDQGRSPPAIHHILPQELVFVLLHLALKFCDLAPIPSNATQRCMCGEYLLGDLLEFSPSVRTKTQHLLCAALLLVALLPAHSVCSEVHQQTPCLGVHSWWPVTSSVVVNIKLHTAINCCLCMPTQIRSVKHIGGACFWGITHTILGECCPAPTSLGCNNCAAPRHLEAETGHHYIACPYLANQCSSD